MKVLVDETRCTGHGLCEIEAEDVFEVGADGVVHLLMTDPDESRRDAVEAAVEACPTRSLSVED